ncbi:hypothetical protein B0H34DRAFT_493870 [Crassisporium funariophilum]|nr:hypothetical protein B0H34DRAFT_493870 [Crassisporium funariophilum]
MTTDLWGGKSARNSHELTTQGSTSAISSPTTIPVPPAALPPPTPPDSPRRPREVLPTEPSTDLQEIIALHSQPPPSPRTFTLSQTAYDALQDHLEGLRYEFDAVLGKLTVFGGPGPVHEAIIDPFRAAFDALSNALPAPFELYNASATLCRLIPHLLFRMDSVSLRAGEFDPMFVVEVGVSQTTAQLRKTMMKWLYRSEGYVRFVVVIDVEKPRNKDLVADPAKWSGVIEIWARTSGAELPVAAAPAAPQANNNHPATQEESDELERPTGLSRAFTVQSRSYLSRSTALPHHFLSASPTSSHARNSPPTVYQPTSTTRK